MAGFFSLAPLTAAEYMPNSISLAYSGFRPQKENMPEIEQQME
jgi:hypothetical protein